MDYAQARMQARHGQRLDARAWGELCAQRDLAPFLAAARRTGLAHWLNELGEYAPGEVLELALRRRWYGLAAELAHWLPAAWGPALAAAAGLIDRPIGAWLASAHPPRDWMARLDPALPEAAAQADSIRAWVAHWRRLWPPLDAADRSALERLCQALQAHVAEFADLPPEAADAARGLLALDARRWFREFALTPAAAFAFLLLQALELERLRGELAIRALAPQDAP